MNLNKLIKDSLSSLNIPIRNMSYSGKDYPYITYFEVNNYDEDYSDDSSEIEVHSLQIDLWTKTYPTNLKKEIKKALKSNGFYDVQFQDLFENDTKIFHIAFRCYFYEEMEE